MKQLATLLMIIAGLYGSAFAQTKPKTTPSKTTTVTKKTTVTKTTVKKTPNKTTTTTKTVQPVVKKEEVKPNDGTVKTEEKTVTKDPNGPQITLAEDQHDFGKIQEGVQAEYDFKFTNTGKAPLMLTDVRPSCGCTTPSWPKEPILPGKTGVIKVSYNSTGRPGAFHKSITITTNIPDDVKYVFIKGEVQPAVNLESNPNQSPVRLDPQPQSH